MSLETILLTLHILGAGVVIGTAILALSVVIKPPVNEKTLERLAFVGKFGMWGSIWQFATGLILYLREPGEFNENVWFWVKIALYVLEGTISSSVVSRQVKRIQQQLAEGKSPSSGGLRGSFIAVALAIMLIASIGVVLVSGHQE